MKVVISGRGGFLGSALDKALLSKQHTTCRITQDLLYNPLDLHRFFQLEQPDVIYHLASYGNMHHQDDIAMTVLSNIIGTFNMLKESLSVSYRAFIYTSSSSAYGTHYEPMKETDLPLPNTFYGASKLSAEYLCRVFSKQYQKPIISARLFSVYGPGEADFRFIPTVIKHIIKGFPFPLDAKANHDWIYIQDVIDALLLIMEHPFLPDKVIYIGSGVQHNNREICDMIKKVSGKDYLPTLFPKMRGNDSEMWTANVDYLRRLGWYPKILLLDGLKECWDYYSNKYVKDTKQST